MAAMPIAVGKRCGFRCSFGPQMLFGSVRVSESVRNRQLLASVVAAGGLVHARCLA